MTRSDAVSKGAVWRPAIPQPMGSMPTALATRRHGSGTVWETVFVDVQALLCPTLTAHSGNTVVIGHPSPEARQPKRGNRSRLSAVNSAIDDQCCTVSECAFREFQATHEMQIRRVSQGSWPRLVGWKLESSEARHMRV